MNGVRSVGLPGSGGDASAGQALSASSVKIASACTGLAAGAYLAGGVVPGVGGIGLMAHRSHAKAPPATSAAHRISPSRRPSLIDTLPKDVAAPTGIKKRSASTHERTQEATRPANKPSAAQAASPASNSPSAARVSGRQTGTELGAESGGQPLSASPQAPSSSAGESGSGSAAAQGERSGSSGSSGGSGSEFGM